MLLEMRPGQREEIARQIGRLNICAISGGRIKPIEHGIELPVGSGYSVRVELHASDTYVVSRIFKRGGKEFVKGVREAVYCDEVGEAAYYASCFRSYDEDQWPGKRD